MSTTIYPSLRHETDEASSKPCSVEQDNNIVLSCKICAHHWQPRNGEKQLPQRCPQCRSTRWNLDNPIKNKCLRCGHDWVSNDKSPTKCPNCHSSKWNSKAVRCKCRKCGHSWEKKKRGTPKKCPACKSYYWNVSGGSYGSKTTSLVCSSDAKKWMMTPYRQDLFNIINSEEGKDAKVAMIARLLQIEAKDAEVYLLYLQGTDLVAVSIACGLPFEITMNVIQEVECTLFNPMSRMAARA